MGSSEEAGIDTKFIFYLSNDRYFYDTSALPGYRRENERPTCDNSLWTVSVFVRWRQL